MTERHQPRGGHKDDAANIELLREQFDEKFKVARSHYQSLEYRGGPLRIPERSVRRPVLLRPAFSALAFAGTVLIVGALLLPLSDGGRPAPQPTPELRLSSLRLIMEPDRKAALAFTLPRRPATRHKKAKFKLPSRPRAGHNS